MLLEFLITITSLFALLFFILWYRTFKSFKFWEYLPVLWRKSIKIKKHHEKAISDGKRPFYFENGTVVIYAKTQSRALYDYNQIKLSRKRKLKVVK